MSFVTDTLARYALTSAVAIGASKVAGYYAYDAAKEAVKTGISFACTAAKTSAQFAVASGIVYLGYKGACALHEYTKPVNRLFDRDFNEQRAERIHNVVPPLTLVASTLPLIALTVSKLYF